MPAETPDYLAADYAISFKRRTRVAKCGRAGLTRAQISNQNGCWEDAALAELVVVEEATDWVRIVHDRYGLRYAIYLDVADLAARVGAEVVVSSQPKAGARPLPITLLPGAAAESAEQRGAWLRVAIVDEGVEVGGWIKASGLAKVYDHREFATPSSLQLKKSVDLLDRPGGQKVAKLAADTLEGELYARSINKLGEPNRGLVEIEVITRHLRLRGFAPARAVAVTEPSDFVGGADGGGWGASDVSWLWLRAGTPIHVAAGAGAAMVAVASKVDVAVAIADERQAQWVAISFMTAWGMQSGWVVCPAYIKADADGPYYRCTSADDPNKVADVPHIAP